MRRPMKILAVIPHYYNPIKNFNPDRMGTTTLYDSLSDDPEKKIASLQETIWMLNVNFGAHQRYHHDGAANTSAPSEIDVVVCCLPQFNVCSYLRLPQRMFSVHPVDCPPLMIGFAGHEILGQAWGKYDYYCFLEDDTIVYDVHFFRKLAWFNKTFGDDWVLLPQRYENSIYAGPDKRYGEADLSGFFQGADFSHKEFRFGFLGTEVVITTTTNLHSGCFFLNAAQMRRWMDSGTFLDRDTRLISPLESAATLGLVKNFRVVKPAPESAAFLEVRHHTAKVASQWWGEGNR